MSALTCVKCRGPVVGAGFFTRIIHEESCAVLAAVDSTLKLAGIPWQRRRCGICRENMANIDTACHECSLEIARTAKKGI